MFSSSEPAFFAGPVDGNSVCCGNCELLLIPVDELGRIVQNGVCEPNWIHHSQSGEEQSCLRVDASKWCVRFSIVSRARSAGVAKGKVGTPSGHLADREPGHWALASKGALTPSTLGEVEFADEIFER